MLAVAVVVAVAILAILVMAYQAGAAIWDERPRR